MSTQLLVFKNNLPNLTALKLFSQDIDAVKSKLRQKLKQAPMMFIGMQLVIDVSAFDREPELVLDIDDLLVFLRGEGINPVALMSDKAAFREIAIKFGIGALPSLQPTSRPVSQKRSTAAEAVANEAVKIPAATKKTSHRAPMSAIAGDKVEDHKQITAPANTGEAHQVSEEPRKTFDDSSTGSIKTAPNNQIIRHPVRSGQRIYVHGDLTVIGTVSPGAEVIADGNIHVYGKLGGRAIAGAQGDETAAIFCQQLDAELVAIAGNYKQLDDIDSVHRGQRVQILLENEKICFFSL